MKHLKPALWNVLRDKNSNALIVAVLLGFSLTLFINFASSAWSGITWSAWWNIAWHQLLGVVAAVVLAELISRIPKH